MTNIREGSIAKQGGNLSVDFVHGRLPWCSVIRVITLLALQIMANTVLVADLPMMIAVDTAMATCGGRSLSRPPGVAR